MRRRTDTRLASTAIALALGAAACRDIDRFDTSGDDAYCGAVVDAQFVRTTESQGGFERSLRVRLEIDSEGFATIPARLTSDDAETGPCQPLATFDDAPLLVTPELLHDPLSQLRFGDAQEQNLVTWAESTCRGPMLAVVSLLTNDDVELRLLAPPELGTAPPRPAFALFQLSRRREDCGF